MKTITVTSFCFFVYLCVCTDAQKEPEKVKVTVYYESLCPDSKKFINNQLYPALTKDNGSLAMHVDLVLVPFGKAKFIYDNAFKSYNFSCHHGPDECTGNKIHACGLKRIAEGQDVDEYVKPVALKFINCMMTYPDRNKTPTEFPTSRCAANSGVTNLAEVENCANHIDGQNYLANYGTKTENLKPALTSVPTIVFNGENKQENSEEAQKNFVKVLCGYLGKDGAEKPSECDAANSIGGLLPQLMLVLIASVITLFYQFHN